MTTSELGRKDDADKLPIGLWSHYAIEDVAQILQYGAKKYATHNWRKGIEWQRIIDSALRHLLAFNAGEDIDPESGLPHLAHSACNLMFLMEFARTHPELDNRYRPEQP